MRALRHTDVQVTLQLSACKVHDPGRCCSGGVEVAFPRCTRKQTTDDQGRDVYPLMPDAGLLKYCCFRPVHSAARTGWTSVSLKAQSGKWLSSLPMVPGRASSVVPLC